MTRTNYFFFILLLSVTLTASSLVAQPGQGPGNGPGAPTVAGPGGGGQNQGAGRRNNDRRGYGGIIPSRVILVRVLELSHEQLELVRALVEEMQDTFGPIREEIAMLGEDLRAELGMENADPLVVGDIVIAQHALRGEIAALGQQFRAQFLEILTAEQLARLQEFIDSHTPPDAGEGGV